VEDVLKVGGCLCYPDGAPARGVSSVQCPRCQHENRPQAKFCEECGSPSKGDSPTTQPDAEPKSEVEDLGRASSEALEQQTATAGILRVISSSPTDVQPGFAAVLRSAASLCDAFDATIFQVDGDELRIVAHEGPIPSPEGGRVGVTATAADGVITITVSDTGIGIAPQDQAAIFEEFRQVGREDARKQEGTGLGLTLAKKFVELLGGRIWVESQVGQGSTFTFTLPVRLDQTSASDQGGGEPPRP
jgi:Histidine kinase-, DNA gyrase B-, and HSP90-like ATPase